MKALFRVCIATSLLFCFAAQASFGQAQYTLTELGVNSHGRDMPVGMNNLGQVVGRPTGALQYAWMWDQGTLTQLGALGTGTSSSARDINDLGYIVGSSGFLAGNTTGHAFYYANGVMYDLTDISGLSVAQNQATSINVNSVVAGWAIGNDPFIDGKPGVIWRVDPADPVANTTIASFATFAKPQAINDNGDAAGTTLQFGDEALLLEADGTLFNLGQIPGSSNSGSWARDISNTRVAVGGGRFEQLVTHAARWDKVASSYQITDLHSDVTAVQPTAHSSDARAINELQQIVGWYAIGAEDYATMWDPTHGVVNLFDQLLETQGWTALYQAHDINEQGQIVVTGRDANAQIKLALLTPTAVPEPSTFVLLGMAGLACMGIIRCRERRMASRGLTSRSSPLWPRRLR